LENHRILLFSARIEDIYLLQWIWTVIWKISISWPSLFCSMKSIRWHPTCPQPHSVSFRLLYETALKLSQPHKAKEFYWSQLPKSKDWVSLLPTPLRWVWLRMIFCEPFWIQILLKKKEHHQSQCSIHYRWMNKRPWVLKSPTSLYKLESLTFVWSWMLVLDPKNS
jgi:hypothetical protein